MKKLLTILTILISLTSFSQTELSYDASLNIAYSNKNKDTLYVVDYMYEHMITMWNHPKYVNDKPVIISIPYNAFYVNFRKED